MPLLTLGIPTTATAAVMLGAFQSYGIQPGPRLLDDQPELVWGLIASLFIGNTILLALNLPLATVWARLLRIPRPYLYAGILFFASIGAYAANNSTFDLWLLSSSARSASSCAASACRWCRRSSRSSSARSPRSRCGGRCRSATAS